MLKRSGLAPIGWRQFKNNLMRALVWACFGIALVPLVWILTTVMRVMRFPTLRMRM